MALNSLKNLLNGVFSITNKKYASSIYILDRPYQFDHGGPRFSERKSHNVVNSIKKSFKYLEGIRIVKKKIENLSDLDKKLIDAIENRRFEEFPSLEDDFLLNSASKFDFSALINKYERIKNARDSNTLSPSVDFERIQAFWIKAIKYISKYEEEQVIVDLINCLASKYPECIHKIIDTALISLLFNSRVRSALNVFYYSRSLNLFPGQFVYESLLSHLINSKQNDIVDSLFLEMKGVYVSSSNTYNAIWNFTPRNSEKLTSKHLHLLKEIAEFGIKPPEKVLIDSFNYIAYISASDLSEANLWLNQAEKAIKKYYSKIPLFPVENSDTKVLPEKVLRAWLGACIYARSVESAFEIASSFNVQSSKIKNRLNSEILASSRFAYDLKPSSESILDMASFIQLSRCPYIDLVDQLGRIKSVKPECIRRAYDLIPANVPIPDEIFESVIMTSCNILEFWYQLTPINQIHPPATLTRIFLRMIKNIFLTQISHPDQISPYLLKECNHLFDIILEKVGFSSQILNKEAYYNLLQALVSSNRVGKILECLNELLDRKNTFIDYRTLELVFSVQLDQNRHEEDWEILQMISKKLVLNQRMHMLFIQFVKKNFSHRNSQELQKIIEETILKETNPNKFLKIPNDQQKITKWKTIILSPSETPLLQPRSYEEIQASLEKKGIKEAENNETEAISVGILVQESVKKFKQNKKHICY